MEGKGKLAFYYAFALSFCCFSRSLYSKSCRQYANVVPQLKARDNCWVRKQLNLPSTRHFLPSTNKICLLPHRCKMSSNKGRSTRWWNSLRKKLHRSTTSSRLESQCLFGCSPNQFCWHHANVEWQQVFSSICVGSCWSWIQQLLCVCIMVLMYFRSFVEWILLVIGKHWTSAEATQWLLSLKVAESNNHAFVFQFSTFWGYRLLR